MKKKKLIVTKYQYDALQYLLPPENLSVSEWAEKYRVVDAKTSARPGKWKNETTPYLKGIMDEFNNPLTEEIVFVKPTQVGGTEALQNMVGYIVMQDPAPTMIVYPTETLAKSVSENRLQPMMRVSPELRKKFYDNSPVLELQFKDMYLSLQASNSASGLASKAIKYLFMDEVDKYPGASKKEADPISLARERTKTFEENRRIFVTSTPTLKTGHIWREKEQSDVEKHFFVPCCHCGEYIEFEFKNLKFSGGEDMSNADRAATATYVCQECGCTIDDGQKLEMLEKGEWRIVKKNTKYASKVAYWMNTLYSPFVTWAKIAEEWLKSQDDPMKLQNFVNSWLAEPWEDRKTSADAKTVMKRKSGLAWGIVPAWAKILTGGVDVQENCCYWTIRAWGERMTSQNVAYGKVDSLDDITEIMNKEYEIENGDRAIVNLCFIDSGDQTDIVYDYCLRHSDWAFPVKGSNHAMPYPVKESILDKSKEYGANILLFMVDGGAYKDIIYNRMRRENGVGSWMVNVDCGLDYAEMVTAEHKIAEKVGGQVRYRWVPKHSHADNHYLDSEVYAFAAADKMGLRTLGMEEEREEAAPVTSGERRADPEEARSETIHAPEQGGWIRDSGSDWIGNHDNWVKG